MKTTLTNLRRSRGGLTALGLALLGLSCLSGSVAIAQQPGGAEQYQAEKSIDDYMQADADAKNFDYGATDLRVAVWLDREADDVYQRGDRQEGGFQTNADGYAVVYRIDTDGLVTVLWPRSRYDDGFVFGGHEYDLPFGNEHALRIEESEGEGYIEAVVSKYPFDLRALELDFHNDSSDDNYEFRVAGDPFLAMNEVNFAVTGLEDSAEYVVTNYARYYVHRQVDHPRYLCSQCHDDDAVAYDPYDDSCTLTISYDHHWGNRWYDTYGYYPVYWNPVYVYVDPWTWRPWVNFWYQPYYTCAPYYGWHGSYWGVYSWYDSPYYYGDSWTRWNDGHRRYRPLSRHAAADAARKTREYSLATQLVKRDGPSSRQRDAMRNRTVVAGRDQRAGVRGEKPMVRTRSRFEVSERSGSSPGLRIRNSTRGESTVRVRSGSDNGSLRHTAAGGNSRSQLAPAPRGGQGTDVPIRSPRGGSGVRSSSHSGGEAGDRTIRSVTPRQRGSRVWNSRGNEGASERRGGSTRVRSGSSGRSGGNDGARQVKPQTPRTGSKGDTQRNIRTRDNSRSSGSRQQRSADTPRRSVKQGRDSGKRDSGATRSRSSGAKSSGSKSSGSKSSGAKSGGSKSSGSKSDTRGSGRGGSRGTR